MATHFLGSILLTVLVSSASAAGAASSSSSSSTDYCKTKDSCYYEDAMDLCVDERYVPIYDDVDLCDTDHDESHDEPKYDGPKECQAEELDLCDEEKKTYGEGCTSEYVFNPAIKDFMKSKPTDPTAKSIKESLPMLMGSDVFDYTGGEPVPDEKLAMAEGMIKGAGQIFAGMGLMRKCGEPEPVVTKVTTTPKPKLGNVIYGNLEMMIDGSKADAEDAATSALAGALQVPEAAIIRAQLVRLSSGRRLQDQSSNARKYRLSYEVAVPPGQTAEQLVAKAKNLPQTLPNKFYQYGGVTVTDVVLLTPPLTLTKNHGLFLATTTTLTPITEKMTWLQVVSRAVLLIIPCFAGYLGSIPGFEQKFCCK